MRAIIVSKPGPPSVLTMSHLTLPEPAAGEIRVRVHSFGLNRADLLQRLGRYPAPLGSPQDIPGLEHAGVVDALGPDVEGIAVGDRVMGIVGGGAYAEYLVTAAAHVVPVPEGISLEYAAAIPEVFITAHDALERLSVQSGEWVLVHAVGSGVGTAATQLIHARGASCIGTSRTESKLAQARELGMKAGVNTANGEFAGKVLQVTQRGVDAAVDLLGGAFFPQTLECMAHRGRILLVGLSAGTKAETDLGTVLRRRLTIEGTVLRSRSDLEKAEAVAAFRDAVLPDLASGRLVAVVDRVFGFHEVVAAHEYLESNRSFGKVVVQVG
ncbi:MAG: NAD(P)H-quinone oxidoreductase [Gemmatimonadota bacterium]|nr:MAG: NAD(P)H-quinone oxidoreductase [Gemmatimonadota bacterium]